MSSTKYIISLLVLITAGCWQAAGQRYPERKHIRSGNRDYERLDYGAAEEDYRTAVSKNPASFEAAFNVGDALYKQEQFEAAENAFGQLLEAGTLTEQQTAKTLHNLGNAQFAGKKLKEAAESYMKSLIINPADIETKFNLAYVQKLLEQQQGGGGDNNNQNQDNSDQNNSDNQDQSGDRQNNDRQENNSEDRENNPQQDSQSGEDQQNNDRDGQSGNQGDNGQQDQQPQPEAGQQRTGAMNREDAEKMLEAMQQQEDKTRDKVDEKQASAASRNNKNW